MVKRTLITGYEDGIPIIACFRDGKLLRFWCEQCKEAHIHSGEDGHRVAHCGNYPNGYILRATNNQVK